MNEKIIGTFIFAFLVVGSFLGLFSNTVIGSSTVEFFDSTDKPYGKDFKEWIAEFWNWLNYIPKADHPRLDMTGEKCDVEQNDQNVWFLAQVAKGYVERHCDIPAGKSIFVPILTGGCDFLSSPELKSREELAECPGGGIKGAFYHATIDGVPIKDIQSLRTDLFNTTIYPDNVFSDVSIDKIGPTQAIVEGHFIFIKSLSPGPHTLEFTAGLQGNPILNDPGFLYTVKYFLNITST